MSNEFEGAANDDGNFTLADWTNEETIKVNLKVLKFFAYHDALVTALLFLFFFFSSPTVALLIFSVPYLDFLWFFLKSRSLSKDEKSLIKQYFPAGRFVIFRAADGGSAQAFSLPFLRMILIPRNDLDKLVAGNSKRSRCVEGVIAHELGHLHQHDRFVLLILLGSLIAFILLFVTFAPQYLLALEKWTTITVRIITFALLIYGVASILLTMSRITHRREFIADLEGFKLSGAGVFTFLEDLVSLENDPFLQAKGYFKNLTHPSSSNRLALLSESLSHSFVHAQAVAFQWLICVMLFVYMIFGVISKQLNIEFFQNPYYVVLALCVFPIISLSISSPLSGIWGRLIKEYLFGLIKAALFMALVIVFMSLFEEKTRSTASAIIYSLGSAVLAFGVCGFIGYTILFFRSRDKGVVFSPLYWRKNAPHALLSIWNFVTIAVLISLFLSIPLIFYHLDALRYESFVTQPVSSFLSFTTVSIFCYRAKIFYFLSPNEDAHKWTFRGGFIYKILFVFFIMLFSAFLSSSLMLPIRHNAEFLQMSWIDAVYQITPSTIALFIILYVMGNLARTNCNLISRKRSLA